MMTNLMTISVKKVSISSKLATVSLSCPPLCGLFSIQLNANGGLSYKASNRSVTKCNAPVFLFLFIEHHSDSLLLLCAFCCVCSCCGAAVVGAAVVACVDSVVAGLSVVALVDLVEEVDVPVEYVDLLVE